MENTKSKQMKERKQMKDRKVIKVPFFKDEFEALGVSPESSYYEAVGVIRTRTGCVIGLRNRESGVSKSVLYNQFKNASDEQKKTINEILGKGVI